MIILPVIHFSTREIAFANAEIAFANGCDGVFVINMGFEETDAIIPSICALLKQEFPDKKIGVNFLYSEFIPNLINNTNNIDMIWTDDTIPERYDPVVDKELYKRPIEIYESFAFKYKREDSDFVNTGKMILSKGRIPTTSGPATGQPPSVEKVLQLSELTTLALASGLDPNNVHLFKNHITHALVATGISETFYKFDPVKVKDFVQAAKG
jgi:hypothetical protein